MKARTSFGQRTLPRDYFVSTEIFQTERERIFYRSWLLVGHVSQLETSGSYFLFEIDRESVIVLRDGAGEVRAFHNHCRHRGSRLCQHASGQLAGEQLLVGDADGGQVEVVGGDGLADILGTTWRRIGDGLGEFLTFGE
jgi:nitrite reductase/ring-hydroxylating ferredoxin subunit